MLYALLALACTGKTATEDLVAADISSIRVEPAELALTTGPGAPAEVDFTAWATLTDGGEEVELELVSWTSSSTAAGDIDSDGLFTTVDTNGGVTTITANHLGIQGTALVTVTYEDHILADDAPDGAAEAFDAASPSEGDLPALYYPLDEARVPRNLEGLTFAWDAPSDHNLFRLRLESELSDVSVYTTSPTWDSSSDIWALVAATNTGGEVSVHMESGVWSGGSLSDVAQGPALDLVVNRLDARGSVIYWASVEQAIMRIPFGADEAEVYWADPGGECVGCHVMNEARDRMVVTHSGWNGAFSTINLETFEEPERIYKSSDEDRFTFSSIHPDGELIAGAGNGTLYLYDLDSGELLQTVDTEQMVTMPVWSPEGDALLVVHISGEWRNDATFTRGEIAEYPWDGESFGSPRTVAYQTGEENLFAPAYSPDGEWIAYNRTDEGLSQPEDPQQFAAGTTELWLMSRDGLTQIRLDRAMGDPTVQHRYPRWAPLPDDDVLWLAWSSNRPYAPLDAGEFPQIWVTAIDTVKAAEGEDPSEPAFWLPGQDTTSNNHLPVWWKD